MIIVKLFEVLAQRHIVLSMSFYRFITFGGVVDSFLILNYQQKIRFDPGPLQKMECVAFDLNNLQSIATFAGDLVIKRPKMLNSTTKLQ